MCHITEVSVYLRKLILSVNGLHAIVISDRDGVPVLRMTDANAPEKAIRPSFLSSFTHNADQASKIGLGDNSTIIAFFENAQIVQMNKHPLLVTFIADPTSITGEIVSLEPDLQELLDETKKVVTETQQP
ncbi:hypothetical protein ACOMHN_062159 [Nucella lapillus]